MQSESQAQDASALTTNCWPHRPEHDTVGRHSGDVASAGEGGGSKSNFDLRGRLEAAIVASEARMAVKSVEDANKTNKACMAANDN